MREWGIYPENFTPRQWWGARAIIKKGAVCLLPDRQNYEADSSVTEQERADMFNWMSSTMDAALQAQAKAQKFNCWEDYLILDSEDGRFHCEASPKNSGGDYLYIGCWQQK